MNDNFTTLRILGGSKEKWHEVIDTMFELMYADVQGHKPNVSQEEVADYIVLIGTLTTTSKGKLEKELHEETTMFKKISEDGELVFRDMEQVEKEMFEVREND